MINVATAIGVDGNLERVDDNADVKEGEKPHWIAVNVDVAHSKRLAWTVTSGAVRLVFMIDGCSKCCSSRRPGTGRIVYYS